jgi:hypothetical protein
MDTVRNVIGGVAGLLFAAAVVTTASSLLWVATLVCALVWLSLKYIQHLQAKPNNVPPSILAGTGGKGGDGGNPVPSHWDAVDRQRIRDALREAKEIMTDLANANVQLHSLVSRIRSKRAMGELTSLREHFATVRARITTRFIHGQDDGNEVHAALASSTHDVLNLVTTSIDQALKAADAAEASPQHVSEFFEPHFRALADAQSRLADWVSQSLGRIEKRRREIPGD